MTPSTQPQTVVATYDSHAEAEGASKSLQQSGFDMKRLSIIGKDVDTEEHALGFYTSGDRIKMWAGRGAFWGSLWGLLFGGAIFFIRAIGPLVVMGPLVGGSSERSRAPLWAVWQACSPPRSRTLASRKTAW